MTTKVHPPAEKKGWTSCGLRMPRELKRDLRLRAASEGRPMEDIHCIALRMGLDLLQQVPELTAATA